MKKEQRLKLIRKYAKIRANQEQKPIYIYWSAWALDYMTTSVKCIAESYHNTFIETIKP